jgi:hypothetical protein
MGLTYDNNGGVQIPSVWNRATGQLVNGTIDSLFGTSNPTSGPKIGTNYAGGSATFAGFIPIFEESSDSPVVEFGEQCTIQHTFFVDYIGSILIQTDYQRGTVMQDNVSGPFGPNVSRVLSTNSQPIAKSGTQICKLQVISEAQSFANPPDEFDVATIELNPPAEKHPRYSGLTYYQKDIVRSQVIVDSIDIKQQFQNIASSFSQSNSNLNYPSTQNQQQQALELMFKKQKGEDNFYLSGYKIIFSQYFWQPVQVNPGGYIENPFTVIPSYYWTDGLGFNIFSQTQQYNPNVYIPNQLGTSKSSYGISWLRQSDELHQQRTWFKLTSTWVGGVLGQWDNEWYNGTTFQPYQTASYQGSLAYS